jgi:hypothetical protein
MTKIKERLPRRIEAVKGDECNCGRRATVLHCLKCGSTRIYARMNRLHKMMNGETKIVENEYRCQTCGHLFIDEEREFCDAPPFTAMLARLKAQRLLEASKSNEFLAPEVIAKAQELQAPDQNIKAIAEAEAQVNEPAIDWSTMPTNATEEQIQERLAETRRMSAAETVFRKEWANKKLVGQSLPSVDEYVERRMKGELFE